MRLLNSLDAEDLPRWRMVAANKDLVDSGYPGMSIDEARNALLKYYSTLGDLLTKYEVPSDSEGIIISHITGAILQLDTH